jgi:23S rRNA A2030 N6-methylase RlmJ
MAPAGCEKGPNVQHGNVGNFGDILKHAALVSLAKALSRANAHTTINYLDTHAYLLTSRLANTQWQREVMELCVQHPRYEHYYAIEQVFANKGRYLCSAGLARIGLTHPRLYLSEKDPATREQLQRQLGEQGITPDCVLDEVQQWQTPVCKITAGPLLALIDPFVLTEAQWQAAVHAVERLHKPGEDGFIEVFTYDKAFPSAGWPEPPRGWVGPVAQMARPPYFLAVYATPSVKECAMDVLQELGWAV